jgi:hypothetical protein
MRRTHHQDTLPSQGKQDAVLVSTGVMHSPGYSIANIPLSSPHRSSTVIQRAAKDSIQQPALADKSAAVPDLSNALVTQIQDADDSTKRQQVLDDLLNYLDTKGVVDRPNGTEQVIIEYEDQPNAANATTQAAGNNPNDPVRITVYSTAFDDGPSVLYSTLRHELIHSAQRMLETDENAASDDEYMHEDVNGSAPGPDTSTTLQLPLQEIETHTWELLHADETGISANATYMQATINDLVKNANTVIETVEDDSELVDAAFTYWSHYLDKAVALLANAYRKTNDKNIKKMMDTLQRVIDTRSGDSTGTKKKRKKTT